jgi:predicted nucleotidyltransferase
MSRGKTVIYIQPDARGRIQLPKVLREFRLFKLGENADGYQLTPLRVVEDRATDAPSKVWLTAEVNAFIDGVLIKKLSEYFSTEGVGPVTAVFLYGSRARGDALSKSDFDIGLLVDQYPASDERHRICDDLQEVLKSGFETLIAHGVDAEPSFHFFSSQIPEETISPIYFSIVTEGRLIWQRGSEWTTFSKKVKRHMRERKVESIGEGKKRQWKWVTR